MEILISCLLAVDTIILLSIASFLYNLARVVEETREKVADMHAGLGARKRLTTGEDSGLMDISVAGTYDPRFTGEAVEAE
jgi:hypothetical protein